MDIYDPFFSLRADMEFFKPWVGTSGVNIFYYPFVFLLMAVHGFHVVMSDRVSNMSVHFVRLF